jgi:hypothetical protein
MESESIFLNASIYWNPFGMENIIFGPFASINYLSVENWSKFNTNGYIFSSGLKFSLRTYMGTWKYPFHVIGSEVGYKNISGKHGFYFTANFDINTLGTLILRD